MDILKKLPGNDGSYLKITRFLILAFVAECTFGGSGRWLEIGPLSIRMILFAACFVMTLPYVLRDIRRLAANLQVIVTVAYGVYLLVCAVIGIRTGNQMGFIWADISTMMTLALLPGFMAVMSEQSMINRAVDVLYWSAAVVAAITVAMHFILVVMNQNQFDALYELITGSYMGGIAKLKTGMQRVYLRSQMFLQVGIVYGVWKMGCVPDAKRRVFWAVNGLMATACILSYTRGFWLGLGASACLLLLLGVRYWKKFVSIAARMLAVFMVFTVLSTVFYRGPVMLIEVVNRFDPSLIVYEGDKTTHFEHDPDEENMDDAIDKSNADAVKTRQETIFYSHQRIAQHPILGNGLGENLDEIRDDGRTEYMYMDQIVKTGFVGLALFLGVYFSFVGVQTGNNLAMRKKGKKHPEWTDPVFRDRFLTAAYLGIAVTSFFNPFLNNPMGIMLLLLTSTAVYTTRNSNKEV